ncbi:lipopolysaccharide biosynthesis protein [Streptomyces agglomeratus]|uniref:Lipopolysaccharide biosynthesis protein n=1 Tax=Streptomyces agglomeratus TaxID=285458 RepID=A0A1E5P7H8_9ACTN|nr:lipopolysaccharide biosynthesis protein [Streptomyces agglomeratus]OEJ25344.1 lipopolysaccharide biosynthesis protein [Streptomyces agglomeratus]OEJ40620.1 lipopolysaccharide biosynthesis protein [Streptomyces agglomeratus]OEJ44999.1 lipopolysaccharide biosynthesis protein [Streptomyces agglomeratus]OEJ53167.1 lipopolysaccharide biosynthesis protein [Streptomyces agglomeratus]OEJ60504.1 lipopolysaccharide biosynthesis protein [Streptomyces agglomeratus]
MTESPEQQPAAHGRIGRLLTKIKPHLGTARLPVWWPVPVCAVLGTVCGASYGAMKTPEYAATSYVVAVPAKGTDPTAALGYAQAYGRITTSDSTLAYARVAAGVPPKALRTQVSTETSPDSPMIAITGTATGPAVAADIANAVAEAVFVSSNHVSKNTGVKLLVFSRALTPTEPTSPSVPVSAAVGGCAGGLLGGLALLVRPRRPRRTASAQVPAPTAHTEPGAHAERELV